MKYIPLVQVCDFQGGSQPPKDQWIGHEKEGYIRMLQIRDFTQPDKDNVEYVHVSKTIKTCNEDDILIGRYGASVGKILTGLAGAYNVAIIKTIPDTSKLSKRFLYHYLNSPYFQNFILSVGSRAAQAGFNKEDLSDAQIPDMSLEEQGNVVSQLDKVSELIALRKEQLAKLDQLVKSRFIELFGDMLLNEMEWDEVPLETLADVVSGITKGRKVRETDLVEVPYMAVSNVKDGYIDWTTVKTIMATKQEIEQYRLLPYDVLMTEGGDPDKLGRGAVIVAPLENSIHQNHIFRVRLQTEKILPVFFSEYLQHQKAKRYFLRSAKQTTGIASINMKQLRALPVLVPPLELQEQFVTFVEQTDKSKLAIQQSLEKLELLKKSLMQEYFG